MNISNYKFVTQESDVQRIQKILAVIYSTFIPEAKKIVINDLTENIPNKINLALLCMYENFNLQQGFTRQSFDKVHKQGADEGNDALFNDLLTMASQIEDESDRMKILKTIYLHSPILSINNLKSLKDLVVQSNQFLPLLGFCKNIALRKYSLSPIILNILRDLSEVEDTVKRDAAVKHILEIYTLNNSLKPSVKEIALQQIEKLSSMDEEEQSEKEPPIYLRLGIELIAEEPGLYSVVLWS